MANYLLNEGYKKICFAMPASRETSTIVERQNGLTMAFREHGMIADESLWITDLKATPVSYTHLDVYKRQGLRTNFPALPLITMKLFYISG